MCYARKRVPDYGSPMKIRLLSWNVRGANDSSKRKVIEGRSRSVVCKKEGARFWKSNEVKVTELECAWS